jgi:hypothetical protein
MNRREKNRNARCENQVGCGPAGWRVCERIRAGRGPSAEAGPRVVLTRLFCRFDTIATVFVDGGHTGTLIE